MLDEFLSDFILLFAVIDPIGTLPVFFSVTSGNSPSEQRRIAFKAIAFATGILLFFLVVGEPLLNSMGVPLAAFQIAGGIVLFLVALSMIFGESKPESELSLPIEKPDPSIYPLAIPSIASPGAILAAVLLTRNDQFELSHQIGTAIAAIVVLAITLLLLLLGSRLFKYLGNSGSSLISRIMGLILASVAVSNVLEGLRVYFNI